MENLRPESNALVPTQAGRDPIAALGERLDMIRRLMKEKMVANVDFGVIPGTSKRSLWQPGAEKLGVLFGIHVDPAGMEDLSGGDEVRFRAKMTAADNNGCFLGSAYAEACSFEEKYRWRRAVCDEEWEETIESRRRVKWGKSKGNRSAPYKVKQVLRDPEDLRNTIIFMAQKRAFVALMRRVTCASDIFTTEGDTGENGAGGEAGGSGERTSKQNGTTTSNKSQKDGKISDNLVEKLKNMIADFEMTEAQVLEVLEPFGFKVIEEITEDRFVLFKKKLEAAGEENTKKRPPK